MQISKTIPLLSEVSDFGLIMFFRGLYLVQSIPFKSNRYSTKNFLTQVAAKGANIRQ